MMTRFVSPRMEFTVTGPPLAGGRRQKDACFQGGKESYVNLVRLSAKMAMKEWDFQYTEEPIYIAIGIYVGLHTTNMPVKEQKERLQNNIIVLKKPYISCFADNIIKGLKGLVFRSEAQIVSLLVIKKYSKRERIEVLIGRPSNTKELEHDIRNA